MNPPEEVAWSPITSLDPNAPWWDKSIGVNAAQAVAGPGVQAAASALGININPWDYFVGAVAVGGMLIGLWMIAGSPKPEVIPVPA